MIGSDYTSSGSRLLRLLQASVAAALATMSLIGGVHTVRSDPPPTGVVARDQRLDTIDVPPGTDSVSASQTFPTLPACQVGTGAQGESGCRAWNLNMFNRNTASVTGAQVTVDTTSTALDLTNSSEFGFTFQNGPLQGNCPAPTSSTHETCPASLDPATVLQTNQPLNVSTSPNPQSGVPIPGGPITLGYDSARIVGPVSGGVAPVTVPITLATDARYTDALKDNQIGVDSFNDSVVPGSEAITVNGNPVPQCTGPSTTACWRELGDRNRGGPCISARLLLEHAQTSITYSLSFKENQPDTCAGSIKPGLRISAAPQAPPTTTPCDSSAPDCAVTYTGDSTLGSVTYSVGSGQITSMDIGHEEDYVVQYATENAPPATPSAFVIGDQAAGKGANVTFWGAQWSSLNPMTNGSAPNSFKGFASPIQPAPGGGPSCGPWTADPGKSGDPPSTVDNRIIVRIASTITKSGSTISGDTVGFAIVDVNPGYGPSPGHAGTGTVEMVGFCHTRP